MEHIFELESFTQEMDGCTSSSCGNNCRGACVDRCRGGYTEVGCKSACAEYRYKKS
ncbi:MAG: hypothetical protein ACI4PK_02570 [Oscillospiraceae bacterium]